MRIQPLKLFAATGAVSLLLLPFLNFAQASPTSYCTQGPEGYNVRTDAASYNSGTNVNFCLRDDTRTPMFLGTMNPWMIVSSNQEVVYQPPSGTGGNVASSVYFSSWNQRNNLGQLVQPGIYNIVFMVNGIRSSTSIIIAQSADTLHFSASDPHTSEPVNVTQGQSSQVNQIIFSNNNQPVTVLVDLEIKDANNHIVSQAYFDNQSFGIQANQLYSVPIPPTLPIGDYVAGVGIFHPGWNGLIQWIDHVHVFHVVASGGQSSSSSSIQSSSSSSVQSSSVSSAQSSSSSSAQTSSSSTSSQSSMSSMQSSSSSSLQSSSSSSVMTDHATVAPQNASVRAGTTIDFNGRNFGIEEAVTVTSDGMMISAAHADGGGNFTTGSLPVPTMLGAKTYTLTGMMSHITKTVTITITP
jgi:hypothetical protein